MNIRPATMNDAELLLAWRNDPLTRQMSKTQDVVQLDGHLKWLTARLARSEPGLFIAEIEGRPVATYRIDGDEISYTVAPDHRRKGIASELLQLAAERHGPKRAEIFPSNIASIKAAARAGHRVVLIEHAT